MKRILCLIALIPLLSTAQNRLNLTLSGGFANYYGDLQARPLTLDQAHGALGLGLKYDITDHFAVKGGLFYAKLSADDKTTNPRFSRVTSIFIQGWLSSTLWVNTPCSA